MTPDVKAHVKLACDDLYCDPFDEATRARVCQLLGADLGGSVFASASAYRRQLRIACDELHDDPSDVDAQHTLLLLLKAGLVESA
jgi:hypothetical protein